MRARTRLKETQDRGEQGRRWKEMRDNRTHESPVELICSILEVVSDNLLALKWILPHSDGTV